MKNKKIVFGILLLFAITGISSIQNVSAFTDTIYIPPSSYVWYNIGDLTSDGWIWIDINSDEIINVYIMNDEQLDNLIDSGGLVWNYYRRWRDILWIDESYTFTMSEYYHIVLYNKALFTGRNVDIDISIYHSGSRTDKPDPTQDIGVLIISIIAIVIIVSVAIILVKKHKRKTPEEVIIIQEKEVPKILYCRECGVKIDKTKEFCSRCGVKITN